MASKRRHAAIVLAAVALWLLVACGGTDGEDAVRSTASARGPSDDPTSTSSSTGCVLDAVAGDAAPRDLGVVVFTRTEGFRHPSIEQARDVLAQVGVAGGWGLVATEDPDELVDALDESDLLVLANTSGDVFDEDHQQAVESWVRGGGGVVAVHSATDTEYDWPFYGEVVGAWSAGHPPGLQQVDLDVEVADHPSTAHLPPVWSRLDEFYDFDRNPRDQGAEVLLVLDEATASYEPGARAFAMGDDHPVAWTLEVDDGRAFTTNLGHRPETWCDPAFQQHLLGGAAWAAAR